MYDDAKRTINNWSRRYEILHEDFRQLQQDHDFIHRRMLEYGERNQGLERRNNHLLDQIGQLSNELNNAQRVLQAASRRYNFSYRRSST